MISTAAGMIVSRVATDEDIGTQLFGQLFTNPQVLIITAAILGVMGLIPGMPHFAFLLLAGGLRRLGRTKLRHDAPRTLHRTPRRPRRRSGTPRPAGTTCDVDALGLEVGYRLIPLVDKNQDGELLRRIKGLRKKFAQEIGFLTPAVHIRDNLELQPNGYRITLKGVEAGSPKRIPACTSRSTRAACGAALRARARPRIRPARDLDRRQYARAGAGIGLYGGGRRTVVATHITR